MSTVSPDENTPEKRVERIFDDMDKVSREIITKEYVCTHIYIYIYILLINSSLYSVFHEPWKVETTIIKKYVQIGK